MSHTDSFEQATSQLNFSDSSQFLVTGCAGFIGSHVLETLLSLNHKVIGLDNFATGKKENFEAVRKIHPESFEKNFEFVEGDIRDKEICDQLIAKCDYVIHLAALGSVPRSIADPRASIETNIIGFFNIIDACRNKENSRMVYASSSSIYGDDPNLPKQDGQYGHVLSPYAASKRSDELIAEAFANVYSQKIIGLRFFNVFGPRQNPDGPYAAVIPRWATSLLAGDDCTIFGDGETSRDFTYVKNVILGLLLSLKCDNKEAYGKTLNLACGSSTSLNTLYDQLKKSLGETRPEILDKKPLYADFRLGDIRHSTADISLMKNLVGYEPLYSVPEGLQLSSPSFLEQYG